MQSKRKSVEIERPEEGKSIIDRQAVRQLMRDGIELRREFEDRSRGVESEEKELRLHCQ